MSKSSLLRLPPEMVTMVMCQVNSPRDLSALVRTSKYMHGMFKYSETAILEAVIRNAMPGNTMKSAVAACDALEVSRLWYESQPVQIIMDARAHFLQIRSQPAPLGRLRLRDQDLLKSLYRLWWTTERFMQRYNEDASRWADQKFSPNSPDYNAELHKVSPQRLQGAFIRFELFRRIHPPIIDLPFRLHHFTNIFSQHKQVRDFLAQFPPWEREEMLSIHEFLISYARDMVRESMDWSVREILAKAQELSSRPGVVFEKEPLKKLLEAIEYDRDDGFDIQPFTFLAGRGLPHLEWLAALPQKHRIDVIGRASDSYNRTLFDELYHHNYTLTVTDCNEDWAPAMTSN